LPTKKICCTRFALALPIKSQSPDTKTAKDKALHQGEAVLPTATSSPPTHTSHTKPSTSTTMSPKQDLTYYHVPDLYALDPAACEVDLSSLSWMQPIVIDDEDLMIGGKALSEWYEEDRRRLSSGSDDGKADNSQDEERRGRERVRRHRKVIKVHQK
jgi:hypothetical protein